MKRKTIEKILNHKFNSFLKSITDPQVQELVKSGTIITGGSIASMLLNDRVNDFDLYFKDLRTVKAITKYFVKKFKKLNPDFKIPLRVRVNHDGRVTIMAKSIGVASESYEQDYQFFEGLPIDSPEQDMFFNGIVTAIKAKGKVDKKIKYKPIFLTTNAISLSDDIQVIIRFYGKPEEIHENYDFVHCMNYWTSWDRKVVLKASALESLITKDLKYVGSLYPICSMIRTRKFIERGFKINAGQFLKMAFQVNELNLKDIKVLQDQLTGVDIAYFMDLIKRIKQDGVKDIDGLYISKLIDEIF